MTFGEKLKQHRKLNGLTQVELAKKLEIGKSTLAMYETDKREPNVLMIKKISKTLNVSADELIGIDLTESKTTSINEDEQKLLDDYQLLNEEGQERAKTYIEDLVATGRYKKSSQHKLEEKQA